jgi:hypothetical protein
MSLNTSLMTLQDLASLTHKPWTRRALKPWPNLGLKTRASCIRKVSGEITVLAMAPAATMSTCKVQRHVSSLSPKVTVLGMAPAATKSTCKAQRHLSRLNLKVQMTQTEMTETLG